MNSQKHERQMTRRSRAEMIATTRAKLLATARQAFATQGYAHASMDDITASAGLTRGALYHHFGGKEGLLIEVIMQIEVEVAERLRLVSQASPTPWEGFRRRCLTYLELALEPEIRRIILQDARAILGDVPKAAQSAGIAALQASLDGLMKDGVVAPLHSGVLAQMVYGAITEASFWIAEPDADAGERLQRSLEALNLLLGGLRSHRGEAG